MKEEALKLADELDALHQYVPSEAPAMIRRLVEEVDKQQYQNELLENSIKFAMLANTTTKPLSDEEIWEWFEKNTALTKESALMIARAIEKEHGIK